MAEYNSGIVNRTDCNPWRDADTLRWAYHGKNCSSRAVASLLGTTKSTVLYWMEKHGIDRDAGPYRDGPWRDADTLHKAYVEDGRSMGELANDWDTSAATIHKWVKRHDIEHRHEPPSGPEHPQWIDGRSPGAGENRHLDLSERECVRCGTWYKPCDHRQEYCSRGCWHDAMKQRTTLECPVCGDVFEVVDCQAERRTCCSYECLGELKQKRLSGTRRGQDNPNWAGGHEPYYGADWSQQRQRALERDGYQCQVCGQSDDLHVHHIRPFREFGAENHKEANRLSNLVCLCPEHHVEWEGIPLRPSSDG